MIGTGQDLIGTQGNAIFIMPLCADGLFLMISYICLARVMKHISATEVSAVLQFELFFGPLFVFAIDRIDIPSLWTIVGGALLFLVLLCHEVVSWYQQSWRYRHGNPKFNLGTYVTSIRTSAQSKAETNDTAAVC